MWDENKVTNHMLVDPPGVKASPSSPEYIGSSAFSIILNHVNQTAEKNRERPI